MLFLVMSFVNITLYFRCLTGSTDLSNDVIVFTLFTKQGNPPFDLIGNMRDHLDILSQVIFPGEYVVRELDNLTFYRGKPRYIRVDNGPEFMSKAFIKWCDEDRIRRKKQISFRKNV